MSDTVKYSDGLLTSDEFITMANENNDKNLQLQKDLAKKVYENTYASLERQYNDTATSAGVAKERNLVDADTAYKLNDVKYGAEAEAMGRMGLTGSGMGEYRQAEAYAQNRADRQASYAEYDRVMREAAYNRDQGKLDAEVKYSDALTNAEINHNNTATAISEKELGYAEGERAAIDSSYSAFIDGINNGTMTIDEIKADSYWSKLSPEQQKAVESAWTVKGFKNSIDNGTYKDEGTLTSSEEFSALTDSEKSSVKSYFASYHAGRTRDASAALLDYLEMASLGTPIDTIMAAAQANGHYDILNTIGADGKSQWDSVKSEADRIATENEETENKTNIEDAIVGGATLEDVQKMDGWNELGETEQNAYKDMIEDRDEGISGVVDYIIEGANAVVDENGNPTINSLSALNSFLNSYADSAGNLLSNEIKEKVVAKWTNSNADYNINSINDAKFENGKLMIDGVEITGAMLAEEIKNGVFGDRADEVKNKFIEKIVSDITDLTWAIGQLNALGVDANEYLNKKTIAREGISYKIIDDNKIEVFGITFESREMVLDQAVIDYLDSVSTSRHTYVRIGNSYYFNLIGKPGVWLKLNNRLS